MRKYLAVVASAALLSGTGYAAAETIPTASPPPTDQCAPDALGQARGLVRSSYAFKRWKKEPALPAASRARLGELAACLGRPGRRALRRHWRDERDELRTYRRFRAIATEPGFKGEGPYLEHLVIPRWVVAAETNGYSGAGRWRATNPSSGACGPYQLNGHTSCDTSSDEDKLRHHRVAASLPRGSWAVGY